MSGDPPPRPETLLERIFQVARLLTHSPDGGDEVDRQSPVNNDMAAEIRPATGSNDKQDATKP
jgi:hypothetical protein